MIEASRGCPHPGVVKLSQLAFLAFDDALRLLPEAVVMPAVPILFFGDLLQYRRSPLRVVTAGLNPSLAEFPPTDPFRRFSTASQLAGVQGSTDHEKYLEALCGYFRAEPYGSWFATYEPLLEGMDASFYDGRTNTALHTDLCSPVATSPTWSRLPQHTCDALLQRGRPLWHDLIRLLQPHVILASVARGHLGTIDFAPASEWTVLHRVERSNPYVVSVRRLTLAEGVTTSLVFGKAAQNPFGLVGTVDKRRIGAKVRELIDG